ncbi:META domain-containing protein [Kibdelosporangium philippinense]|uniref:META domain-containing protein n=1 Tax=Kibdelosporangium philippinense TaxID=211113 RepID=A0ABS8ZDX1_9PSEU|nr:META domain-containing protein [Kibdelosporangium philippinense]MCE7006036.1 META domain-containing protein [Kibdelosporangium philippinense]
MGVLVAGCAGQQQAGPGSSGDALKGRVFVSQTVTEKGKPRPLADGTQIQFEITDKGELQLRAGCNHMSGPADTGNARLAVASLTQTEMGCDKVRLDQDQWLADIVEAKPNWELTGDTLKLKTADTEIVFGAKQATQLEGPTWVTTTVVESDIARPAQVPAWLTFNSGTVLVTTRCNTVEGSYQATSETIIFRDLKSTGGSCPEADAITPILDGEFNYKINNESLSLTHASGRGLQLRVGTVDGNLAGKQFVSDDGTKLTFENGQLTATVGCNDMTGTVIADEGKLVVQSLGKTRKACEPEVMDREDRLTEFLKSVPDFGFNDAGFTLSSGQTTMMFKAQ